MDLIPFYYYGAVDMAKVRAVKAEMDVPFKVKPVVASVGVPGITGRVLATVEPPFACDYAYLKSEDGLRAALEWCWNLTEDKRATTIASWLGKALGGKVVEVHGA